MFHITRLGKKGSLQFVESILDGKFVVEKKKKQDNGSVGAMQLYPSITLLTLTWPGHARITKSTGWGQLVQNFKIQPHFDFSFLKLCEKVTFLRDRFFFNIIHDNIKHFIEYIIHNKTVFQIGYVR